MAPSVTVSALAIVFVLRLATAERKPPLEAKPHAAPSRPPTDPAAEVAKATKFLQQAKVFGAADAILFAESKLAAAKVAKATKFLQQAKDFGAADAILFAESKLAAAQAELDSRAVNRGTSAPHLRQQQVIHHNPYLALLAEGSRDAPQNAELTYTLPSEKGPKTAEFKYTIPEAEGSEVDNTERTKAAADAQEPAELTYTLPKGKQKAEFTYTIPSEDGVNETDDDADDADDGDDDDDVDDALDASYNDPKWAALRKESKDLTHQLDLNQMRQSQAKAQLTVINDERASDAEIEIAVKAITNQTDSKALATTLGKMWSEMREYAHPFFKEHLEGQLAVLRDEERQLSSKLEVVRADITRAEHVPPPAKATLPPVKAAAVKDAAAKDVAVKDAAVPLSAWGALVSAAALLSSQC